jgi:hypothetical protein
MSIETPQDEHGNAVLRAMKDYEVRRIGGDSLLIAIKPWFMLNKHLSSPRH